MTSSYDDLSFVSMRASIKANCFPTSCGWTFASASRRVTWATSWGDGASVGRGREKMEPNERCRCWQESCLRMDGDFVPCSWRMTGEWQALDRAARTSTPSIVVVQGKVACESKRPCAVTLMSTCKSPQLHSSATLTRVNSSECTQTARGFM
jgi:hypothetical protein